MEKILFIVTIASTIIIVFSSLTTVVGCNNADCRIIDSPLFEVRSKKITNKEFQDVVNTYICHETKPEIHFPRVNNKNSLVQDVIKKLDETILLKLFDRIIKHQDLNKFFQKTHKNQLILILNEIRENPNSVQVINMQYKKDDSEQFSYTQSCTYDYWGLGCFLKGVFAILGIILIALFYFISVLIGNNVTMDATIGNCCNINILS